MSMIFSFYHQFFFFSLIRACTKFYLFFLAYTLYLQLNLHACNHRIPGCTSITCRFHAYLIISLHCVEPQTHFHHMSLPSHIAASAHIRDSQSSLFSRSTCASFMPASAGVAAASDGTRAALGGSSA